MPFTITTETRATKRHILDDWQHLQSITVDDGIEAEQTVVAMAQDIVIVDDERTGGKGDLYEYRITVTHTSEGS